TKEIAALNRFLVTGTVLVSLKLDGRVERVSNGARVPRRDGEGVDAVDEEAGLPRLEDGCRWKRGDEVLVELHVECVDAVGNGVDLSDPGAADTGLVVRVVAALRGRGGGGRGAGARNCDQERRQRRKCTRAQAPDHGASATATDHEGVLSLGGPEAFLGRHQSARVEDGGRGATGESGDPRE